MENKVNIKIEIVPFGQVKANFEYKIIKEKKSKSYSTNLEPLMTNTERSSIFYSKK
ncbi:MAG: hypothetical protein JSV62_04610 [Promethearchaeota archaeon]|nr:MAG: hypothetical protein JSV62_04610 [Candidatus Lokiarchaeota archaeon]